MFLYHSITELDLAEFHGWFFRFTPLNFYWKLEYRWLTQNLCLLQKHICMSADDIIKYEMDKCDLCGCGHLLFVGHYRSWVSVLNTKVIL
jgi:hypothetical protein